MYIGVDGCRNGWVAVCYDTDGYAETEVYHHIDDLWEDHGEFAETILIDNTDWTEGGLEGDASVRHGGPAKHNEAGDR